MTHHSGMGFRESSSFSFVLQDDKDNVVAFAAFSDATPKIEWLSETPFSQWTTWLPQMFTQQSIPVCPSQMVFLKLSVGSNTFHFAY